MYRGGLKATDGGTGEQSSSGLGLLAAPLSVEAQRVNTLEDSAGSAPPGPQPVPITAVARARWMRLYRLGLVLIDLAAASVGVAAALVIRFGVEGSLANPALYGAVAVSLPIAWVALAAINRAYEDRFVGAGAEEFQRVFRAFLYLTALVSFAAYTSKADVARGFILVALPLALAFDLIGRYRARRWLHGARARGRAMTSVLAVGDAQAITVFAENLRRDRYAGMQVVGACLTAESVGRPDAEQLLGAHGVAICGDVDSVFDAVTASAADTVAVVSSSHVGPDKLRWISWQLEGTNTSLVVSPGLVEVAGPRLHIRPVAGLPLLHVEQPEFRGFRRFLKGTLDRAIAAVAVLLLLPLLAGIWLTVRLTSRGPALFRQTRVGRNGRSFTILKFRSMFVDAGARLAELQDQNVHGSGPLFKIRDDPRVTAVGRVLRKYSLDELPQLVNVVAGQMSLVGPRPPLPSEVDQYGEHVRRRLLVKPGLTGLWQVSGRSDLDWEESVRLDLRYVENWSPALDLMILWKTLFAVVHTAGAY